MDTLAELAERSPENLTANASPALRAALERHVSRTAENATGKFNSFISPTA